MAFENLRHDADQLQEESRAYLEASAKYYKLWGFKVAMQSSAIIVRTVIIVLCVTLILFFASIAASIAIGLWLDSYVYGFLSVAGIYVLILLMLLFVKDNILRRIMLIKFSEIYFNEK